jgi:biopolymer transport protein ExbB
LGTLLVEIFVLLIYWSCLLFSIIQAAGWPIWPIIICSIIAMAIVVERFLSLKSVLIYPPHLLIEAIEATKIEPLTESSISQLAESSVLGQVLASGLAAVHANPSISEQHLRSHMESAGREAGLTLEKYLPALATIASAAPLLGLLGTVIGMIEIFGAQSPAGGATGANPAQLAHGISVALYNTALGLIVAIPSLIFWRYFRTRVDAYLVMLEGAAERFANHLATFRK